MRAEINIFVQETMSGQNHTRIRMNLSHSIFVVFALSHARKVAARLDNQHNPLVCFSSYLDDNLTFIYNLTRSHRGN